MQSIATITYGISVYPEAFSNFPKPLAFIDALTRTLAEARMAMGVAAEYGGGGTITTSEDLSMALDVTLSVPVTNLAAFLDNTAVLPIVSFATITAGGDESDEEIALLDTLTQAYPQFSWETP